MNNELTVHFKGIQAHAAGAAHMGRSALDAMLLTFQGINFLREHIPLECHLDYTVIGNTGPANIIYKSAHAHFELDAPDQETLTMLNKRVFRIHTFHFLMNHLYLMLKHQGHQMCAGDHNF